MTYARIVVGPDGDSHFEDVTVSFRSVTDYAQVDGGAPVVQLPAAVPTTTLAFLHLPPGMAAGWHPAPRRQFDTVLGGTVEMVTGSDEVRQFEPGAVLLVEDITGKGHRTRALGAAACLLLITVLADESKP